MAKENIRNKKKTPEVEIKKEEVAVMPEVDTTAEAEVGEDLQKVEKEPEAEEKLEKTITPEMAEQMRVRGNRPHPAE